MCHTPPSRRRLTALLRLLTSLASFLVSSTRKSTSILSQGVLYLGECVCVCLCGCLRKGRCQEGEKRSPAMCQRGQLLVAALKEDGGAGRWAAAPVGKSVEHRGDGVPGGLEVQQVLGAARQRQVVLGWHGGAGESASV